MNNGRADTMQEKKWQEEAGLQESVLDDLVLKALYTSDDRTDPQNAISLLADNAFISDWQVGSAKDFTGMSLEDLSDWCRKYYVQSISTGDEDILDSLYLPARVYLPNIRFRIPVHQPDYRTGQFLKILRNADPFNHQYIQSIEMDVLSEFLKDPEINPAHGYNHIAECADDISANIPCRWLKTDGAVYADYAVAATDQLAFLLCAANENFAQLLYRNIPADVIMQSLQVDLAVGTDFFIEIAKLKAFRLVWANFISGYIDPDDGIEPSEPLLHVRTAKNIYFEKAGYENLLRSTTSALSAVLGGAHILTVLTHAENDHAHRLAVNVQQMLNFESHINSYKQSADGSYLIESLSLQIAEKAWNKFRELEKEGGFITAVKNGAIQETMKKAKMQYEEDIRSGKKMIVGINKYEN